MSLQAFVDVWQMRLLSRWLPVSPDESCRFRMLHSSSVWNTVLARLRLTRTCRSDFRRRRRLRLAACRRFHQSLGRRSVEAALACVEGQRSPLPPSNRWSGSAIWPSAVPNWDFPRSDWTQGTAATTFRMQDFCTMCSLVPRRQMLCLKCLYRW